MKPAVLAVLAAQKMFVVFQRCGAALKNNKMLEQV
jgi:hypothetical protein